jgi:hypothetical protein
MNIRALISASILGIFWFTLLSNSANNPIVSVWVSCEGTVVSRTDVGKLEISRVEPNSIGCLGKKVNQTSPTLDQVTESTGATLESELILDEEDAVTDSTGPRDVILFDLKQTDIVNYRLERMRQNQIRYANAIRSVRMRNWKSMESKTNAYLIKNDAVLTDWTQTGWVETQWITLDLLDPVENTIVADSTGKAQGYVPAKYLREANPSDLVRIRQADNAYWSDLAHVEVDRYVNVRLHPWYGAPIVTVLTDSTVLYIVSTVDDWSEVMSDDRKIQWYVKSKYLVVDKSQRVEQAPLLK